MNKIRVILRITVFPILMTTMLKASSETSTDATEAEEPMPTCVRDFRMIWENSSPLVLALLTVKIPELSPLLRDPETMLSMYSSLSSPDVIKLPIYTELQWLTLGLIGNLSDICRYSMVNPSDFEKLIIRLRQLVGVIQNATRKIRSSHPSLSADLGDLPILHMFKICEDISQNQRYVALPSPLPTLSQASSILIHRVKIHPDWVQNVIDILGELSANPHIPLADESNTTDWNEFLSWSLTVLPDIPSRGILLLRILKTLANQNKQRPLCSRLSPFEMITREVPPEVQRILQVRWNQPILCEGYFPGLFKDKY
ncbi:MAG: hypothetical protein LBJ92_03910 [Holosporales bacterium]|jgi:hypothetical protein|nr:hypothetical protein [Holosporales bacterium]